MITRNNNVITKFLIVLGVIILIETLNVIMILFVEVNDTIGYSVIDMLFFVKYIAIIALFIPLFRWNRDKDYELLKERVLLHTKYVFIISLFYFIVLYIFKYSLVLDVMDILRNKMIEGNPELLLNFSVFVYNRMKFVRDAYQNFNSELILLMEMLFVLWNIRNIMDLKEEDEEVVVYDNFMYNTNLRLYSSILVVTSFLSINLFEYIFYDFVYAIMFFVSFFLFSLSVPLQILTTNVAKMNNVKSTKNKFLVFNKLANIISIVMVIGFVVLVGLNIYVFELGLGTYRMFTAIASFGISTYILFRIVKVRSLVNT